MCRQIDENLHVCYDKRRGGGVATAGKWDEPVISAADKV